MVRVKPFCGIRPPKEYAAEVASRPYDVLNSVEAKAEATGITEYFSISGARLNALQQGINIVRYPDGTVRKVFVK